jgi:hypothetical protein
MDLLNDDCSEEIPSVEGFYLAPGFAEGVTRERCTTGARCRCFAYEPCDDPIGLTCYQPFRCATDDKTQTECIQFGLCAEYPYELGAFLPLTGCDLSTLTSAEINALTAAFKPELQAKCGLGDGRLCRYDIDDASDFAFDADSNSLIVPVLNQVAFDNINEGCLGDGSVTLDLGPCNADGIDEVTLAPTTTTVAPTTLGVDCLAIGDASFEDAVITAGQSQTLAGIPNNWDADDASVFTVAHVPFADLGDDVAAGFQAIFAPEASLTGSGFWQDLDSNFELDTVYTLSVSVGRVTGVTYSSTAVVSIRDSNNQVLAFESIAAGDITEGGFSDVVVSYSSSSADVGQPIRVAVLFAGSGTSLWVDNFSLCTSEATTTTITTTTTTTSTTASVSVPV